MTVIQQRINDIWVSITADHEPGESASQLVDYINGNPADQFRIRPEGATQFGARLEFAESTGLEPMEVTVQATPSHNHLWVDEQTLRALLSHSFASDALWNDPNRWWTIEDDTVVTVNTDEGTVQLWRPGTFYSPVGIPYLRWCLTSRSRRELHSLGIQSVHIHENQKES